MQSRPSFSFSMIEPEPDKAFDLMPGDVAFGLAGDHFKTLLGSCVSVILTDPRRTVGAMCHIVHVNPPNAANQGNSAYGEVAMREMFRLLRGVGVSPELCHAFVFGGGNMFPKLFLADNVGAKNARWVMSFLAEHRIAVINSQLEGAGYRKVSWTVGLIDPLVETVLVVQEISNGN